MVVVNGFNTNLLANEALMRDALIAYDDYVLTGLHLSAATAEACMDELISGKDADIPPWQIDSVDVPQTPARTALTGF